MKKNLKIIIASSAAALAFGALAVGTTFALFTDKDDATIDANAGKINVEQAIAISSVSELGEVGIEPVEGVYTNSIGGKTYIDPENPSALHLEKWAPGDSATIEIRNVNKSNIDIYSRFGYYHEHSGEVDLDSCILINIQAFDEDDEDITENVEQWYKYNAAEDDEGYLMSRIVITLSFIDHDEGEIDFESYDNQFQDASCTYYFSLETVQGNAFVENNDSIGI